MASREHDLQFGKDEALWRRIEHANLTKQRELKPQSLRLQISVVREKYGTRTGVTFDKWNGIAEVHAGTAASVSVNAVRTECVDDPTIDHGGHALIALVATPGVAAPMEDVNAVRAALAKHLRVVQDPSKV